MSQKRYLQTQEEVGGQTRIMALLCSKWGTPSGSAVKNLLAKQVMSFDPWKERPLE